MAQFRFTSLFAYWICAALIVASTLFYYPKWTKSGTEATISWDVSGYYIYLPGALIYKDLKQLEWWPTIAEKYHPGPGMGQAFQHESGNWVMKYPLGQALQFLPWFTAAHLLAEPMGYPADGFSKPYQVAIGWGSLLIALLGLWYFRKVLKNYFSDPVVSATMICIVFGSNYLEYAGITGAMTHNWLFTLYAILISSTLRFYRRPNFMDAALIGVLVGWATITRPTEIIAAIIPIFWGVNNWATLKARFQLFGQQIPKLSLSVLGAAAMIGLQLGYWKYATGHWLVYSYQDQSFTWLPPHIEDVLWSARAGWLVYSPMMIFAVIGIFMLRKRLPSVFPTVFFYCMLALYITSAWDIWWYGGSLGQRAMIQAYPLWAFGLATFVEWISALQWRKIAHVALKSVWLVLAAGCIYLSLWWSHQAHKGGLFVGEQMTRAYMLKILGRFEIPRDAQKLLDTREEFKGKTRTNVREVFTQNFDADSTGISTAELPISGTKSMLLNKEKQASPEFDLPIKSGEKGWVRTSCSFRCDPKEGEFWRMTQFIIRFRAGDKIVKDRLIRLQRHVDGSEVKDIFFDTSIPKEAFDRVSLIFWNADSDKSIRIDELRAEVFQ